MGTEYQVETEYQRGRKGRESPGLCACVRCLSVGGFPGEKVSPRGTDLQGRVGKQIPETEIRDFYCKDTIFLRYRKGLSRISSVLPFFRPLEPPLSPL